MSAKIYLVPNLIAPDTADQVVTNQVRQAIKEVDHYLVENVRNARRYISSLKIKPVEPLQFTLLNKHTSPKEIEEMVQPLKEGYSVGIISDAGCPGIADPGSLVVAWGHKHGIPIVPLVGPSSILLALMASGMNGQSFEFRGYLPIESSERKKAIKQLESESLKISKTQIFMETPYRNQALFEDLLRHCHSQTRLCVARDLTSHNQFIATRSVAQWKSSLPDLHKKPTIFLMQA